MLTYIVYQVNVKKMLNNIEEIKNLLLMFPLTVRIFKTAFAVFLYVYINILFKISVTASQMHSLALIFHFTQIELTLMHTLTQWSILTTEK